MEKTYVEQHDGGYWIAGTRISLDSVVYAFRDGAAAESIQRSFPLLSLEQVYGAIAYYLGHEHEIDDYLLASEIKFEAESDERRQKFATENPQLWRRLMDARKELQRR